MSIVQSIRQGFEAIASSFAVLFLKSAPSYCDLQSADSQTTLVADDGRLQTIVRVKGVVGLVGEEEFQRIHGQIHSSLNSLLKEVGHTVTIHFSYNQDQVYDRVNQNYSGARQTAEKLELDKIFTSAGAEWRDAGCSMCLGMNPDKLVGNQLCASSSNRNFKGRQGSPTGRTLLMSPIMVAAAAVTGEVSDARDVFEF